MNSEKKSERGIRLLNGDVIHIETITPEERKMLIKLMEEEKKNKKDNQKL